MQHTSHEAISRNTSKTLLHLIPVPHIYYYAQCAPICCRFGAIRNLMKLLQIAVVSNCSILAAVGQKMASTPGVSATLFNALAKVRKLMDLLKMLIYICISRVFRKLSYSFVAYQHVHSTNCSCLTVWLKLQIHYFF